MILIGVQAIIFGWFYGIEKLVPTLNELSTFKVGKTWIFIIKYILPILLIVIWVFGIAGLFNESSMLEIAVDLFITLIIVCLSYVFTKIK